MLHAPENKLQSARCKITRHKPLPREYSWTANRSTCLWEALCLCREWHNHLTYNCVWRNLHYTESRKLDKKKKRRGRDLQSFWQAMSVGAWGPFLLPVPWPPSLSKLALFRSEKWLHPPEHQIEWVKSIEKHEPQPASALSFLSSMPRRHASLDQMYTARSQALVSFRQVS